MFAFVILHYCAIDETIKCVESIFENFDSTQFFIVIVDNASPNHTGQVLADKYRETEKCHVILNTENLGFAVGNNIGFAYAKQNGAQFICVMNSDTYLLNDVFRETILHDYERYHYYVLGPKIIVPGGVRQSNPMGRHVITYKEACKKIFSLQIQIGLAYLGVHQLLYKVRHAGKVNEQKKLFDATQYYENVQLQGCCWVFSPLYIAEYNGINGSTFLYLEEDLLYLEMMQRQHKTLYSPNVLIFHSGEGSSDYIARGRKKRIFTLKQHLKSMKAIKDVLQQKEETC